MTIDKADPNEVYLAESPPGTYRGLQDSHQYFAHVQENEEQLKLEQIKSKSKQVKMGHEKLISFTDERNFDSCTCIYGSPYIDEGGCRNWKTRFDVANKNGWSGDIASLVH
jgi:hypothetical protein